MKPIVEKENRPQNGNFGNGNGSLLSTPVWLQEIKSNEIFNKRKKISSIDDNAFAGLEDTLELLDLERNNLNNISTAFDSLKNLRYLYFSNNNISEIRIDSFAGFGESLRALSLSGNKISVFPRDAVRLCTRFD